MEFVPDVKAAQVATEARATVRRLLVAYADTLDVVDSLPLTPMVATGWHWWSKPGAPIRVPRVSWMLRSLMLWHIDRVLAGAERAFHRRAALGIAATGEADALDAVTEFRASLPSRSRALRIGVLALAALVVAHLLATVLPRHLGATKIPAAAEINKLFDDSLGSFQPTVNSVGSVVSALFKASPSVLAAAAMLLTASLYLILRPVASAFRLKRLLLNLYSHTDSMWSNTPASWSMSRSTGIYSLEQETFMALGARAPGEPPFDLLVSLPIPIIGVTLMVGIVAVSNSHPLSYLLENVALGLFVYGAPAAIRLAWLAAAWRARNGRPRSAWLFADELRVPWRTKPVRCRSPVIVAWLSFNFWFIVPIVIVPWLWWSTSRDLTELGHAYGVKHLRDMHPAAQALAVGLGVFAYGLPALIVLFRAPRYVRDAQAAVRLDHWSIATLPG